MWKRQRKHIENHQHVEVKATTDRRGAASGRQNKGYQGDQEAGPSYRGDCTLCTNEVSRGRRGHNLPTGETVRKGYQEAGPSYRGDCTLCTNEVSTNEVSRGRRGHNLPTGETVRKGDQEAGPSYRGDCSTGCSSGNASGLASQEHAGHIQWGSPAVCINSSAVPAVVCFFMHDFVVRHPHR